MFTIARARLSEHPLKVICITILVALLFTSYYTYAVILLLLMGALVFPISRSKFLAPVSTRVTVYFLMFSAWTMTLATAAWFIHITLPQFAYSLSFFALYAVVYLVIKPTRSSISQARISPRTLVSLCLSLVAPLILGASFYGSNPSISSTIQIITNGYDNSAHMSLIRTSYLANGYVYGPYDEIKDQISWKTLTAYPQGWHFVNAYFWKGSGITFFTPDSIPRDITAYVITTCLWYLLAVFLFHQLAWHIARTAIPKKLTYLGIVAFSGASLLLQLLVFWGSLQYGFVTFLGAFAFTFALIGVILDTPLTVAKHTVSDILLHILAAAALIAAVAQGWLFVAPVLAVVAVCTYLPLLIKLARNQLMSIKRWALFLGLVLFEVLPVPLQLYINQRFSTQGAGQINDDGGIFGISTQLAMLLIGTVVVVLSSGIISKKELRVRLSYISIVPLLFVFALYVYQLITLGHPAYFFTKLLAFSLTLGWLPLTYASLRFAHHLLPRLNNMAALSIIIVVFGLLPLGLGQNLDSFTHLLQRNSNLTTETAQEIADTAINNSLHKSNTFVMTTKNINGDTIGTIFTSTLANKRSRCDGVEWLISRGDYIHVPDFLNRCASSEHIQLIASPSTDSTILNKFDPQISIIK